MTPFRAIALLAGCLVTSALAAAAARELPQWAGGLPEAKVQAAERKAPLLVILNMDGEVGNEGMLADVYTDPKVREAMKRCVATVASIAQHDEALDARTGKRACSRFGTLSCVEHRATEEVVRKDWLRRGPKDDVESPRHIFRAPDGRPLFEQVWTIDADTLVRLIDRAVLACVPETLAAWDTNPARLQRAADPLRCVRQTALAPLVSAHDAAIDAQLFELARTSEVAGVAHDLIAAVRADPSPARLEALEKLLAAPSARCRMEAAAAVARAMAKDAFDVLLAALAKEKSADVKAVLVRGIAICAGDPAKTHEFLLRTAKAGDPLLRTHAVVALAPWAKEDATIDAIRKIPAAEKLPEALRAAACWTLGLSGRKDVAKELTAWTEGKSEMVKSTAQAAIRQIDTPAANATYDRWRDWVAPLKVSLEEDGQ